jgi:hypothetical protein
MERTRSAFENFNLQNSIKPANGTTKETIHNGEMDGEGGVMQLLLLEGRG